MELHPDILEERQQDILPSLKPFKNTYYLSGGTAVALYLGHRRSIDFDLFKRAKINPKKILDQLSGEEDKRVIRNIDTQLDVMVHGVKLTFLQYPFEVKPVLTFQNVVRLPSLLDLAAMKAYAMGRRSKWKDYVDLYFLIRDRFSIKEISERAEQVFGELFSEKMFRVQLSYFKDIDYSEEVDFLKETPDSRQIKDFLVEEAVIKL